MVGLVDTALEVGWRRSVSELTVHDGEHDHTLRARTTGGDDWCVKVRRNLPGAAEDLSLELDALVRTSASLPVPRTPPQGAAATHLEIGEHLVWVIDWVAGRRWADLAHRDGDLCRDLGRCAGAMATALAPMTHSRAQRSHHWGPPKDPRVDLAPPQRSCRRLAATDRRPCARDVRRSRTRSARSAAEQRRAPGPQRPQRPRDRIDGRHVITGVIDFGDLLHSARVTELAVAVAYAMLRCTHPLDAAAEVVAGWRESGHDLDENERCVLFPMAFGRLCVNALTWAARADSNPSYSAARSGATWATLEQLVELPVPFAIERLHPDPAPLPPAPQPSASTLDTAVAAIDLDPRHARFDDIDPRCGGEVLAAAQQGRSVSIAHDSVRLDWAGPPDGHGGPATVQLGIELRLPESTTVFAPLAGRVRSSSPLCVDHHEGDRHWATLWHGLEEQVPPGSDLAAGAAIGVAGSAPVCVQLLTFRPTDPTRIPTRVRPADRRAWTALSIDPSALIGLEASGSEQPSALDVVSRRDRRLASSQRSYYRQPMNLVRGRGAELIDANAHSYLDAINNVTHVGHGNEHVVAAATAQMRRLNTNSRFIYEQMADYADRLAALLPDPLEVVFLVCTGSEANDLAMRIARQVTGRTDVMVIDGAYHGNTTAVTGISPDRYKGPGGAGPPDTTHEVMRPDRYRGPYGYDHPDPGRAYADDVESVAQRLHAEGDGPAAFFAESLMGTAGQVVHPEGYLAASFAAVRASGGLCVSDEVQVGFGRLGECFWGFQLGGVVPDIVTMGKPMGNGHPIAAVVTTREIADAFDQGMKYFNTFGGNPVSCAVAGAVLDELAAHDLPAHAVRVGERFASLLRRLGEDDPRIGDVRGHGLYLGIEFVEDASTKTPARWLAVEASERMRERGVIVYPNGVLGNCLKIKPPMVFSDADTDRFVDALAETLRELR